jgi:hypothetical protein
VAQTFLQKIKCSRWKTLPAKPNPKLEEVLDIFGLILAGELRPETVIFLDLEYNLITRRIYEVGICDGFGNLVVDCFTQLSEQELRRTQVNSANSWFSKNFKLEEVLTFNLCRHKHNQSAMDVHDLIKEIKLRGITTDAKVVVWASTCSDLTYLTEWFAAEGYHDVLPPKKNCLTLVHPFRQLLDMFPEGKHFPARLPNLFPLFYSPRHQLSGRNHVAFIDALQTRLMLYAFRQLRVPHTARDKNWKMTEDEIGDRQASLFEFGVPKAPTKRKADEAVRDNDLLVRTPNKLRKV